MLVLKTEPLFTGCFRQCLDASVILITTTIKNNRLDVLAKRPIRDAGADSFCSCNVTAVLYARLEGFLCGRCGNERRPRGVVYDLRVDMA